MRSALLLLALLPPTGVAADIHKCIDANGRTTFSDSPCTSRADTGTVPKSEGSSPRQQTAKQRWPYLRELFEGALGESDLRKKCILLGQVVRLAGDVGEAQREGVRAWNFVDLGIGGAEILDIENQEVSIGMSPCAVYAAWGNPAGGTRTGGVTEHWTYEQPAGNVFFRDGVVTAIDGPRAPARTVERETGAVGQPSVQVVAR